MLQGISASGGFAIGKILTLEEETPVYNKSSYLGKQQEAERLQNALHIFTHRTEGAASAIRRIVGKEEADIFTGHIYMAHDPEMQKRMKRKIARGFNAETAMESACDYYITSFLNSESDITRQKAADVRDIRTSLLHILTETAVEPMNIPFGTVIAAKELKPSAVNFMERRRTVAALAETGTENAHFAVLMRAMGIPAVLSVKGLMQTLTTGQRVIVDGDKGEVVVLDK